MLPFGGTRFPQPADVQGLSRQLRHEKFFISSHPKNKTDMHVDFSDIKIQDFYVHRVGNKANDEALVLAAGAADADDEVKAALLQMFTSPFTAEKAANSEYYQFYHDSGLQFNVAYTLATKAFSESVSFMETTGEFAKYLYDQSTHPKIKAGEFYVVLFNDCVIDGTNHRALGLFKTENRDTYLNVYQEDGNFEIISRQGININKLDKGCIIYDMERSDGFVVSVIDNTNKSEARYWIDDFLHVRQRQDEYFKTQNALNMAKSFITKGLPQEFDVTKADQAELLNKSVQFFKEKDEFSIEEFANEVIEQPEVIESFNSFCNDYQQEHDLRIDDSFSISDAAVKQKARSFKSVIKLDKNFHIYVHGNQEFLQRGYDEASGMYYYQLFFNEEA